MGRNQLLLSVAATSAAHGPGKQVANRFTRWPESRPGAVYTSPPAVSISDSQGVRQSESDAHLRVAKRLDYFSARATQRDERAIHIQLSQSDSHTPILRRHIWGWIAVAVVMMAYVATLTPGHPFALDDFAAYVMHAENLVDGHAYTDIRYVPNPDALWMAPSHGYPPVYPLILAPVYKLRGFDLRAMKMVTVLCFGVFLVSFVSFLGDEIPTWAVCAAILLLSFNLVFWEQRDYLLSEFPYLMFSFCALLVAQRIYEQLDPRSWRFGAALLLSLLLYGAYGTRTIGIVLLPALILADVCKFRRPSRFLIAVVVMTGSLILSQNIIFISPKSYMSAVHLSATATWQHALFYGKTLSYVWRNGSSKPAQIVFALLFTALAAVGFLKNLWRRKSLAEFYLLGYLAVLLVWTAEIGLRGLLPVLPLYFAYGLAEFFNLTSRFARYTRVAMATALFVFVAITYLGAFRWSAAQEHLIDVRDPEARELFAYIAANTQPADVLIFPASRTLALFANRNVGQLAPDDTSAQSADFLASVNARWLVENQAMSDPLQQLTGSHLVVLTPVFQNAAFQMFRIEIPPTASQAGKARPE